MHREYYTWKFPALLILPPLLAAGLFHLVFRERVVREWDFRQLEQAKWQWWFPAAEAPGHSREGGNPEVPDGAAYVVNDTGPGPQIDNLEMPANALDKVRIEIHVADAATGVEADPELLLYWARPGDIAAARGGLAFGRQRSCAFEVEDAKDPHVLVAEPSKWKGRKWDGVIQSMMIAVKVPAAPAPGYKVLVSSISFLK